MTGGQRWSRRVNFRRFEVKGLRKNHFYEIICKIYNHQGNLDCSVTTEIIKKCRQTGKRSQRWISGEMSHCTCCRPYMSAGSKLYLRVVQRYCKIVRSYIYTYSGPLMIQNCGSDTRDGLCLFSGPKFGLYDSNGQYLCDTLKTHSSLKTV